MIKKINAYEKNKQNEMKKYNALHTIDAISNYGLYDHNIGIKNKSSIATYINKNLDKMDYDEIKQLINKVLTFTAMKKILLTHELQFYKEIPKKMSLKKFINKTIDILNRYQHRAGGFYIEDSIWKIHTFKSEEYDVKEYEVMFENSIEALDLEDPETVIYLERIHDRLNSLSDDIKVNIRYSEANKNDIIWIFIWATHNKNSTPQIAL